MSETVNILHLSDLHFGMEPTEKISSTAVDRRNLTLKGMVKALEKVDPEWMPNVVVVSGDIGWKGVESDYKKAKDWLTERLLPVLKLSPRNLIVCPGNHDIDRAKTIGMLPPPSSKEADEWLKLENLEGFSRPFEAYVTFCSETGITPLSIGDQKNYLAGMRDLGSLRFVVLNSAWFCRGDKDKDKLWLGKPLLEKMAANEHLIDKDDYDSRFSPLTVALFHHPPEWLNECEYNTYGNRQSAVEYLSLRSHIILSGHVHARPAEPHRQFNRAWLVKGGTAYAEYSYQNHFSILRIDIASRTFERISHEFDPGINEWRTCGGSNDAASYDLKKPIKGKKPASLVIPEKYRQWINVQCKHMDITKLAGSTPFIQVGLPQIYIPLFANPPLRHPEKLTGDDMRREQPVDIEDLIPQDRTLVIEGRAGCGKTTLLKHFSYNSLQRLEWKGLNGYLPVLIFLDALKGFDPTGVEANSETAEALLTYWSKNTDSFLDVETIRTFCEAGKTIFFLDGLDEIGESLRELVVASFHGLKIKYENCKIVLSGRPHGVDDTVRKWFGDRHVEILPLVMYQVEEFIHKWFTFVLSSEYCGVKKTSNDMIGEIKAHPSIDELIDSPLMLTAICLLYTDENELPGQRAELYDRFVTNLLFKRFHGEAPKVKKFLMELAHEMHTKGIKNIDRKEAVRLLGIEYKREREEPEKEYIDRLNEKFDGVEPGCGLLKFEKQGFGFIHLTFQEFLTANRLVAREIDRHFQTLEGYIDDKWYREVVQLYIGYLSIQSPEMANHLVRQVLGQKEDEPFYRWCLVIRSLIDIHQVNRNPEVVERAVRRLWQIIESGVKLPIKAEAGELLGRLGDERDLEQFMAIPDGTYKTSAGRVATESLEISKYPVTNRWYRKFVEAGGYKSENHRRYWTKNGIEWLKSTGTEHPKLWFDYKWNCPNHPVVGVCWWEADAFCRWLEASRNDGYVYRLPTEPQWEAVAAGSERREYPWGKDFDASKCNTYESGINKTSAVGIFPDGETLEKVADLSGNVWEWTRTDYNSQNSQVDFPFDEEVEDFYNQEKYGEAWDLYRKKHPIIPTLRGGSWGSYQDFARCDGRISDHPDFRSGFVGFRCARTKN